MLPDTLSEVLGGLRLRSYVHSRNEFLAPWGIRIPDTIDEIPPHARPPCPPGRMQGAEPDTLPAGGFYFITEGHCWFECGGASDGGGDGPIELSRGDLVIFITHRGHRLRDSLATPVRPVWEVVTPEHFRKRGTVRFDGSRGKGTAGARTTLIAGGFYFENRDDYRLFSALPACIHLKHDEARTSAPWLADMLRILSHETESYEPGAQTVINHLAHALFALGVRHHVANLPVGAENWLRALLDPNIGPALGRIHASPDVRWTVESLADSVAMSRSTFAAKFTSAVGEPPLAYLTRYRMQKAGGLFSDPSATVKEVAARVGYDSEAAFSSAFKRHHGVAPAIYRKQEIVLREMASSSP